MIVHENKFFNLHIRQHRHKSYLKMAMSSPIISTQDIPLTLEVLKNRLPSILNSRCFNENNYSFSKEVRNTEVGHLFEHILLEYLCIVKISSGATGSTYNGLTKWNWSRDNLGVFHIHVDAGYDEEHIFSEALKQSIMLTNQILETTSSQYAPLTLEEVQ